MRCETARAALSVSMDEPDAASPPAEEHVRTCEACRRFSESAWRLRELARFQVAPPVPDLVPAIMARVREEAARRPARVFRLPHPGLPGRGRWRGRRAVALALAAGLVVGFVLTGGRVIFVREPSSAALADQIPRRLVAAANGLRGYAATFDVTELHWANAVPRRTFVADIAFRAPEDFRVRVRDTTRYPSSAWPRNNLLLVTNGHTWRASGPNPCPRLALPACPEEQPVDRSVVNRPPFDAETAMPTDAIVPMTVLAAGDRVNVVGPDQVAGRSAVAVELAYRDGASLFGYLQFLGSWRPFFPDDRVVVSLDDQTWFPLEYRVFPSSNPERTVWTVQQGLPVEEPSRPIFAATVRSFSPASPPAASFAVHTGPDPTNDGFHDLIPAEAATDPTAPPLPALTDGLRLVRYGEFERGFGRSYLESIVAYSQGLSWLTVARIVGWDQRAPFGVGPFAQPVALSATARTAYYEPASVAEPRRLALHTARGEILIVSNLPRAALLRVAASLPVTGLPQPASWRVHRWPGGSVEEGLTAVQAVGKAGFDVLLPGSLPVGYRPAGAQIVRSPGTIGVTLAFRRPAAELDGDGILLYEAKDQGLPPATGADQVAVQLRGTLGRWSPEQDLLEWVENGTYVSLTGAGLDLATLLDVARSLTPSKAAA